MKLKLSTQLSTHEIPLYKIASIKRIGPRYAQIRMHTGEAIRVRCDTRDPVPCVISYPGTFHALRAEIYTYFS